MSNTSRIIKKACGDEFAYTVAEQELRARRERQEEAERVAREAERRDT